MNGMTFMTRRIFVKGSVFFLGLLAGGGLWRAVETGVFRTGQGPAYDAWDSWENAANEGLKGLIHAAVLASNAHNAQPWKFKLGNGSIDLTADTGRNIGSGDPFLREMDISLGCALENLVIAAKTRGLAAHIRYFPDPDNRKHVANISFSPAHPIRSELYDAIPKRHMNRSPYERNRPIPKEIMQALRDLNTERQTIKLILFDSPQDKQAIGKAMIQATEAFIADKEQAHDSAKWTRQTWRDIQTGKDGITNDSQGLSPLMRALVKMLSPLSQQQIDKFWLDSVKNKHTATAAAYGFITVRNLSDREQMVKAGQLWQRLHLFMTTKQIGTHILNQLSERRDRELQLKQTPVFGNMLGKIIKDDDWHSVIQFRMGYPTIEAIPSPRRPVNDVVFSG